MPVDVSAYAKELMDEAGIADAEQRKQFEAFFGNDKVKAKFGTVLTEATEGIQRERGRTQAEKARADEETRKATANYQENLRIFAQNKALVEESQAEVARYVSTYGELPGGGAPTRAATAAAVQDVIDRKTFDERTTAIEGNTVGLVTTALKLFDQHRRDFPSEPFDVDAIVKTATEEKLSATQAYNKIMGPKVEAARLAKFEAEKKTAIEEALQNDRSNRAASATIDASPRGEFMGNVVKSKGEPMSSQESFLKGWRDPDAKATMRKEFGRD